jgi:Recombinase zinc beta ribbon domain
MIRGNESCSIPINSCKTRHSGPAREGPALLQGLVICGKCGRTITLRYHERGGRLSPDYLCQQRMIEHYLPACQSIPGGVVDDALSTLIQESVSPLALEVALSVQQELQERLAESDLLCRQYVERAQYEPEQARVRYSAAVCSNRRVACSGASLTVSSEEDSPDSTPQRAPCEACRPDRIRPLQKNSSPQLGQVRLSSVFMGLTALQPQSEQHHAPPSGAKSASTAPRKLLSRSTSNCVFLYTSVLSPK